MSQEDGGHAETEDKAVLDANGTQRAIQALLENLHHGCAPVDKSPLNLVNGALNLLCNHGALLTAQENLQGQDKSLDVVFQARISAMIGVLNLFLDPELSYTWREVLMIVAKAQGHGTNCAHTVVTKSPNPVPLAPRLCSHLLVIPSPSRHWSEWITK